MLPSVNLENRSLDGPGIDIFTIIQNLYERLSGRDGDAFIEMLARWWDVYSIIAILLALLFFIGFVYAKIRYNELLAVEQVSLRKTETAWAEVYGGKRKGNNRWSDIQTHVQGENPNDWRLAIIEADIILEETLNKAGYVGTTIGDKLKSANQASFTTIQDAWEAHKVRNQIAHAGSDFILTKKSAQDTITRYERVFTEFGSI